METQNNIHILMEIQDKGKGALSQLDGGCINEIQVFSNLGK